MLRFAVATLALLFLSAQVSAFKVCGYYCGPGWCSDEVISEQSCVADGIWGIPSESGSCADSCCRVHDYCCGSGLDRPACNDAIVSCIEDSDCYLSICGALVWAAMKTIDNWCCGSPCPTFMGDEPMSLTGKHFCVPSSHSHEDPNARKRHDRHEVPTLRIMFESESHFTTLASPDIRPPGTNHLRHHSGAVPSKCFNEKYVLNQTTNRLTFPKAEECVTPQLVAALSMHHQPLNLLLEQKESEKLAQPQEHKLHDVVKSITYFPYTETLTVRLPHLNGGLMTVHLKRCDAEYHPKI